MQQVVGAVTQALKDNSFTVLGDYNPEGKSKFIVIVFTRNDLKNTVIKVKDNVEIVHKAFLSEQGDFGRSKWTVDKKDDCVEFKIEAEDSTALRATLNAITKLLTLHEKVDKDE